MDKKILPLLKPQNVFLDKKRIGPEEDGGYVMPELVLEKCSALFTYGVGGDTRYEEDFVKQYNKKAYLFDHTTGQPAWERDNLIFTPEGLGYEENCKEWFDHYDHFNIEGDIFLKIDVEGTERTYFNETDISKLNEKVLGIAIEIHYIDNIEYRQQCISLIEKLNEGFVLCHTHGNSWSPSVPIEDESVPTVLELSFINKRYVDRYEEDTQDYPIKGLDFSNNPSIEDSNLNWIKNV